MKKILFTIFVCLGVMSSCSDYDDADIKKQLQDHEGRIASLESLISTANNQISGIQGVLSAIQAGDWITSVTTTSDGYTLNFANGSPITIKNGQAGSNAAAVAIGVDLFEGAYYWTITIDGKTEWMTDKDGKKIPTTGKDGTNGKDGKDGTNGTNGTNGSNGGSGGTGATGATGAAGQTPILGVDSEGYWTVTLGDVTEYLKDANGDKILGQATNIPFNVEIDTEGSELIFTFKGIGEDGDTTIRLPYAQPFKISIPDVVDYTLWVEQGYTKEFDVAIKNLKGGEDANYISIKANIEGRAGMAADVYTRAETPWNVEVGKPDFSTEEPTVKVKITAPYLVDFAGNEPNANLTITVLGADGSTSTGLYVVKVENVQVIHIFPNDEDLSSDGVFELKATRIFPDMNKVVLIFDDSDKHGYSGSTKHNQNISVVLPEGFDLPVDIDFTLADAATSSDGDRINLTVEDNTYARALALAEYYKKETPTPVTMGNITAKLSLGSFVISSGYTVNDVITTTKAFELKKGATIDGKLTAEGGKATIAGALSGKTFISGAGTEVYFDNTFGKHHNALRGQSFKTADIQKMGYSQFEGFNALEVLNSDAVTQVLELLAKTGLDMGNIDLSLLSNNDIAKLVNDILKPNFYYSGAVTVFNNPYINLNHGSLRTIEYRIHNGDNKYIATLDKDGDEIFKKLDRYGDIVNRSMMIAGKFFPNFKSPSIASAIPVYYEATNNFDLENITTLMNTVSEAIGYINQFVEFGKTYFNLSLEDIQNIYDVARYAELPAGTKGHWKGLPIISQWIPEDDYNLNTKVGVDNAKTAINLALAGLRLFGQNATADQVASVLPQINDYFESMNKLNDQLQAISGTLTQVDTFINSLEEYNPWVYSLDPTGKTFTGGTNRTTINKLTAVFDLDCNGQAIQITNVVE